MDNANEPLVIVHREETENWDATEIVPDWDPEKEYCEDEAVSHNDKTYVCQTNKCQGVDPYDNLSWKQLKIEHISLLGKYYEKDYDLDDTTQQYDVASLLYATVPNAITTCGISQDEILPRGQEKYIKQLCNYGFELLMNVADAEDKRYNHCKPIHRTGDTSSKSDVDVAYVCLGDDYIAVIQKNLEKNFTPGYVISVDKVFIDDSLSNILHSSSKHVKKMNDATRVKRKYFKRVVANGQITWEEVNQVSAMRGGKVKNGYMKRDDWEMWVRVQTEDGRWNGGWETFQMDDIPAVQDTTAKKKIVYHDKLKKYYVYIPWLAEVLRENDDSEPFFNAIQSYKFKSNDPDERMHISLASPYEGKVSTGNADKPEITTCIPWVSKKVVLSPDTNRKFLYKPVQMIPAAAELLNVHESVCDKPSEEVRTNHFDQYASLVHQRDMMKHPMLQDVILTPEYAEAFKYCSKYDLLKEAHAAQEVYKMQEFPREMADKAYMDQANHTNKKRSTMEDPKENETTRKRPKIEPLF